MLSSLIAIDRRLEFACERIRRDFDAYETIAHIIDQYLARYAAFNHLQAGQVIELCNGFSKTYARHLAHFAKTGEYPFQYGDATEVDRIAYDLVLLISCVSDVMRFQIAQSMHEAGSLLGEGKACIIGSGPGIELEMLRISAPGLDITAYDKAFNPFVREAFPKATLREEYFNTLEQARGFNTIFAIELLEHLPDPMRFLRDLSAILDTGTRLICTTATNMPQFDHLWNFTDIDMFCKTVKNQGFHILEHRTFSQRYSFNNIEARNDWFVLQKH